MVLIHFAIFKEARAIQLDLWNAKIRSDGAPKHVTIRLFLEGLHNLFFSRRIVFAFGFSLHR